MNNAVYDRATEIKKDLARINSCLFDINHGNFKGGYVYIPKNPQIIEHIAKELEEEKLKLIKEFDNL